MQTVLPAAAIPSGFTWPADTGMVSVQSALHTAAQYVAFNKNVQLATEYVTGAFASWLKNYQDNLATEAQMPQPPAGFQVQLSDDGWTYDLVQTGPPVCPVPVYQKVTVDSDPNTMTLHVHVGKKISGTLYWSRAVDDSTPDQYATPPTLSDDGVFGIFVKEAYPWGGWYILKMDLSGQALPSTKG